MTEGAKRDPCRRRLDADELEQLRSGYPVETLGGFTLASLIASANEAGIGPEDLEVSGNGEDFGIELWPVHSDDEEDDPDA